MPPRNAKTNAEPKAKKAAKDKAAAAPRKIDRTDKKVRIAAFVDAYLKSSNASEAYKVAYPAAHNWKPENVRSAASKMLADANVYPMVREGQERASRVAMDKYHVTQDRLIEEWASIAFHDAADYFTWGPDGVHIKSSSELTERQRAAVSGVSQTEKGGAIKVSLSDKQAALKSLGQIMGLFVERKHVTLDTSIKDMSEDELRRFIDDIDDEA
jgi:hypothetical protein